MNYFWTKKQKNKQPKKLVYWQNFINHQIIDVNKMIRKPKRFQTFKKAVHVLSIIGVVNLICTPSIFFTNYAIEDPISFVPISNGEGTKDERYLKFSLKEAFIEQTQSFEIIAFGSHWNGRSVSWMRNNNPILNLEGITYSISGDSNSKFTIINNLNSFFPKSFEITANIANVLARIQITCENEEYENYVQDNMLECYQKQEITQEENDELIENNLKNFFE